MSKLKETEAIKDFKDTPYYKFYSETIDRYCETIIKSQMKIDGIEFDKKYNWNSVLKEVFKFINVELREFKDELNINPTQDKEQRKEEEEINNAQIDRVLGL